MGDRRSKAGDPSRVGLIPLMLPMLLEHILYSTVNLLDVLFISRISDSAVNAVSVPGQYLSISQILAFSVSSGAIICVNQAIGMGNLKKVNRLASIACAANTLLGVIFGLLFSFNADALLSIMHLEDATLRGAARYLRITGGLMIFQCVSIVFNSLSRSLGRIRAPLYINITTNLINVAGNYLVVFHPEITHVDPVAGVAMTSVISQFTGMVIAFSFAYRAGMRVSLRSLVPFPKADIGMALSLGIPGGLNNISYSLCQLVTTALISHFGDMMVSTKVYVSSLAGYVALVSMSFCQANSIMVGYRVGAAKYDEARRLAIFVARVSVLSNLFFSGVLFIFRRQLIGFFTDDPAILQTASLILLIDFAVEVGRALNNSFSGSLTAVGDVRYQLVINQLSGWLISVGCSYLFSTVFGFGLYGVWAAFALDELTRGLIMRTRWRSGRWIGGVEARRKTLAA
ncbi:MAG: MATE family efflux transporter [Clostridia bacterium]|nr:MATE family efflux transporter [Clostridia bacterium]